MSELVLEKNNKLPNGWIFVRLDDLTTSRKIGLDRSRNEQFEDGIPYLKMNNITIDGTLDLTSLVFVHVDKKEFSNYFLNQGDVLFNTRNSFELVGKTAFWNNEKSKCVYNNNIMRIRVKNTIMPKFMVYFMNTRQFKDSLISIKKATTNICAIYDKDLKEQIIPLPPLNEQKRIVAKIEELFSLMDFSKQILKKTKIQLKQYRQSLLKSAFEGKLVAQDPNDKPASMLLEKIRLKKFNSNVKSSNIENLILEKNNEFPQNWIKTTIDDISTNDKGSIRMGPFGSQLKKHELVESGVRVLWIENIVNNKFEYKKEKFITKKKFELLKGFTVKPNDVLITMMGTIGRTCVVPETLGTAIISSHLLKITPQKTLIDSKFLSYLLRGDQNILNQIESKARGVVMKGLNTKIIKSLEFVLPPLNEQKRIVAKIEESFSLVEKNEKLVDLLLLQYDSIKSSILKQAFEGKLVPQDPNDEPAEILLEKIKQEKQKIINQTARKKNNGK